MAQNVHQNLDKMLSKIRRTDTLDWREFNFFKPGVGLTRHDQVSIEVCLGYELGREWQVLVELLAKCSEKQRQDIVSLPETRCYAALHHPAISTPLDELPGSPDDPPVPTACVAASWFPAPWLSGPLKEREKIVKELAECYKRTSWSYDTAPLFAFDFPMDDQREKRLVAWAEERSNTTLHLFAINRAQTESALVTAFRAWIKRPPGISAVESQRGRVKTIAALRDLGCYRLMTKLEPLSRQVAMDEAGFKQSVPKLSEAKQRTKKRLRFMGYI